MELLSYFYHPDHTSTGLSTGLGSSTWITDGSGQAIQHLHYLPFGEDWVDQRNSSWNAPYTFSGKEKDVETGYGYFGARYYDSGLSIWLSVDPMSDKYPSMSPYNYCANNPVMLVDPNGREIWILFDGMKIRYDNGNLFNEDGTEFTGQGSEFFNQTVNALNEIRTNSILGNIMIGVLSTRGKKLNIEQTFGGSVVSDKILSAPNVLESETLHFNIQGAFLLTTDGADFSPVTDLAHELSHAYDDFLGSPMQGETDGLLNCEWMACFRENTIRHDLDRPYRTFYSQEETPYGAIIRGLLPRLLDDNNEPKNPENF